MSLAAPTALIFLLLAGCPSDDTSTDASADTRRDSSGSTGRIELGTGQANFVEIPDSGAELELVAGPQGGWHLVASVRLYDLTIDELLLSYRIEQDGVVISMPLQFSLTERRLVRDGDRWLRQGDNVIFEIPSPDEVVGERVDMIAVAEPPDGPAVSDRKMSILVVDLEP